MLAETIRPRIVTEFTNAKSVLIGENPWPIFKLPILPCRLAPPPILPASAHD
jgi:hypothetical protein